MPSHPPAQLGDRLDVRPGQPQVGAQRSCPAHEQLAGLVRHEVRLVEHVAGRQRQGPDDVLVLAAQTEQPPGRHQHGQARARGQQLPDASGCRDHLLEVVEDHQHATAVDGSQQTVPRRALVPRPDPQRLGDGRDDQLGLADRRERHERDAVRELAG
jgi:hypothetical protein